MRYFWSLQGVSIVTRLVLLEYRDVANKIGLTKSVKMRFHIKMRDVGFLSLPQT